MIFNSRGFSLIEPLIAGAILSAAILGTAVGLKALAAAHKKTQVVDNAIELEAQLLRAITQNSTYTSQGVAILDALRAGQPAGPVALADGLTFDLCAQRIAGACAAGNADTLIQPGQTLCFGSRISNAPRVGACDFTVPDNGDELQVFLSRMQSMNTTPPRYMIGYSITGNPSFGKLALMGSATPVNLQALNGDYSIQIPIDAYNTPTTTTCVPDTTYPVIVGINGFDKTVSPPTISCIRMPTTPLSCPPQTFPKTLRASQLPPPSNDLLLTMDCGPTARTMTCSPGYALENFDPSTLDPAKPAATGSCVYRNSSPAVSGTYQTNSGLISGHVCPPNYHVDFTSPNTTCTIVSAVTAVNGTCPSTWSPSCTSCNGTSQDCTYINVPGAIAIPTGVATASFDAATADTRLATCRLSPPPGACGEHFDATIQMRASCVLNTERMAAVGSP
jgi:type II secretory pathway pseudopilin PulG